MFAGSNADYPRPEGPVISASDLRPADVLLSRGTGLISDCIAAADGGSYSHAALWTGRGVVEAVRAGIADGGDPGGRDAYRFQGSAGLPDEIASAIVSGAREHVGNDYATSELYLLGLLFSLGFCPRRSMVHAALDALGGERASRLEEWMESLRPGQKRMICTELVSSSYYRAASDRGYALRVVPAAERPTAADASTRGGGQAGQALDFSPQSEAINALSQRCHELIYVESARAESGDRKLLGGALALDDRQSHRLGVVTPADLQFSPSLRFIGRVDER